MLENKDWIDRFWARVDRREPDACWLWKGCLLSTGYGQVSIGRGKRMSTHRVAYMLAHREVLSPSVWVLHRCDNHQCVNPSHLFKGTPADNTADMMQKGRQLIGEKHTNAKLTNMQVRTIRERLANGESQLSIARDYSVSPKAIYLIANNETWRYVS